MKKLIILIILVLAGNGWATYTVSKTDNDYLTIQAIDAGVLTSLIVAGFPPFIWDIGGSKSVSTGDHLLLETGDNLLLESGDKLILE